MKRSSILIAPQCRPAIVCLALLFLLPCIAQAKTYTWNGKGKVPDDWFDPGNWEDATNNPGVPGAGDSASLITGPKVILSSAVTVANLAVNGATLTGHSLTVTAICSIQATIFQGSGSDAILNLEGTTTVATDQFAVGTTIQGWNIINTGALTLAPKAQLVFDTRPSTLTNEATIEVQDGSSVALRQGGQGTTILNHGTIKKVAGSGAAILGQTGLLINNTDAGVISCASGTMTLYPPLQTSGTINAAAGSEVDIGDALTSIGIMELFGGATLSGGGTIHMYLPCYLSGTATISGHVILNLQGPFTLYRKGDTTMQGELKIGAGGVLDWQGGSFQGSTIDTGLGGEHSLIDVLAGGQLNISFSGAFDSVTLEIDKGGTATWQAGPIELGTQPNGSSTISNAGTFDIQADGVMQSLSSLGGSFLNEPTGVVQKSKTPDHAPTEIQVPFVNFGNVHVKAGVVQLENTSNGIVNEHQLDGQIQVDSGAMFRVFGGKCDISSGLTIAGPGETVIGGGGLGSVSSVVFDPLEGHTAELTIESGAFTLDNQGSITGIGAVTVVEPGVLQWKGGTFDKGTPSGSTNPSEILVTGGATLKVSSSTAKAINGWKISNAGTVDFQPDCGDVAFGANSYLQNVGTVLFESNNSLTNIIGGDNAPFFYNKTSSATVTKTGGNGTTTIGFSFTNSGQLVVKTGTIVIHGVYADTSGNSPPGVIELDIQNVLGNTDGIQLDQPTTTHGTVRGTGTITAKGEWTNDGNVEGDAVEIVGDLKNGGQFVLGDAPGVTAIQGNFTQLPGGSLYVPVQGTNASTPDFGQLKVTGTATLAGSVFFLLENNFVPGSGDAFPFLNAGSISGAFAGIKGGQVAIGATGATANNVSGLPANALVNISTRVPVGTGSDVLIAGFIVQGPGTKRLLVRGLGPSLAAAGINGVVADPYLELHDSSGAVIARDDNWQDTQQTDIQATGIAPTDNHESAIIATVYPGAYTAVLSGVNGGTGVALVEVYDLDSGTVQPVNISTRGQVQSGNNVMIGGFIIGGTQPMKTIVRAVGPSLTNAGVSDALADPTLELHNGHGDLLYANDNWKDSQAADIQASGIPPINDLESAIVMTLTPGNYTAIVAGKNGATGVGLVEVYNLR